MYRVDHRQSCLDSAQVDVGHSLAYTDVSFEDNFLVLGCKYNPTLLCVDQHDITNFFSMGVNNKLAIPCLYSQALHSPHHPLVLIVVEPALQLPVRVVTPSSMF